MWHLTWWGCIQWCLQRHLSPKITTKGWPLWYTFTFLNLDITAKDGVFVYKLFDKRDDFPFFIVHMLKSICYCALVGEFLRVAHSSLLYNNFNEEAMKLLNRMKVQGTQSLTCRKALSKIFLLYIFLTHDTMSAVFPFYSFLIFIFTFIFFNFLCIYFFYPFVCFFF